MLPVNVAAINSGPTAAREVVRRAIDAAGGRAQLARLHAVTWKARWEMPPSEALEHGEAQGLDQYRVENWSPRPGEKDRSLSVFNGDRAWTSRQNQVNELSADSVAYGNDYRYLMRLPALLLLLEDPVCQVTSLGDTRCVLRG